MYLGIIYTMSYVRYLWESGFLANGVGDAVPSKSAMGSQYFSYRSVSFGSGMSVASSF